MKKELRDESVTLNGGAKSANAERDASRSCVTARRHTYIGAHAGWCPQAHAPHKALLHARVRLHGGMYNHTRRAMPHTHTTWCVASRSCVTVQRDIHRCVCTMEPAHACTVYHGVMIVCHCVHACIGAHVGLCCTCMHHTKHNVTPRPHGA